MGFDDRPHFASEITRYYRPMTEALRETRCFSQVTVVGEHRDAVLVVANKAADGRGRVYPAGIMIKRQSTSASQQESTGWSIGASGRLAFFR